MSKQQAYLGIELGSTRIKAVLTEAINPDAGRADQYLLDKHYLRKHGKNAYYGQEGEH